MTNQNIDFSAPLTLENSLDTAAIERLASMTGSDVSSIRRWMYEDGEFGTADPAEESRRPWLNWTSDLVQ